VFEEVSDELIDEESDEMFEDVFDEFEDAVSVLLEPEEIGIGISEDLEVHKETELVCDESEDEWPKETAELLVVIEHKPSRDVETHEDMFSAAVSKELSLPRNTQIPSELVTDIVYPHQLYYEESLKEPEEEMVFNLFPEELFSDPYFSEDQVRVKFEKGYHQIYYRTGNEWKTASRRRRKYKVRMKSFQPEGNNTIQHVRRPPRKPPDSRKIVEQVNKSDYLNSRTNSFQPGEDDAAQEEETNYLNPQQSS